MKNEGFLLAAIFKREDVRLFPYIWEKTETRKGLDREIWVGRVGYVVRQVKFDEALKEALDTLEERLKRILVLRFGLDDGKARTQREIGVEYGIRGSRVGQLINKALLQLRQPSRTRMLMEFIIPSPEERFKEKQRLLDLEAELARAKGNPGTSGFADKNKAGPDQNDGRVVAALRKAADLYQQKHGLAKSPFSHTFNVLRRADALRFASFRQLKEADIKIMRGAGIQTLEIVKNALLLAESEKEASP